jgi:competence protein ComEA
VVFKVGAAPQLIGSAASGGRSGASQISLNRATQSELEALPGVGPALAGRMIDWRTANGGFKKKEDLLNVSGIGDKLFAGIKDQVTLC